MTTLFEEVRNPFDLPGRCDPRDRRAKANLIAKAFVGADLSYDRRIMELSGRDVKRPVGKMDPNSGLKSAPGGVCQGGLPPGIEEVRNRFEAKDGADVIRRCPKFH